MDILEYKNLNLKGVQADYEHAVKLIRAQNFAAAKVKKIHGLPLYAIDLNAAQLLLFKVIKEQQNVYALMLEVVGKDNYESSRFLNGQKPIEESISDLKPLEEIRYVNSNYKKVHFLNKALSFDNQQVEIYREPLPVIIIGSAGSGKTMLALEKLKTLPGECLYVSLSSYLVNHSQSIYYANNYQNADQEITFLSFNEFIETIRIPKGKPMDFYHFKHWCARYQSKLGLDRLYEEFRGTLTGSNIDKAWLSKEDYLNLGVKQSLFLAEEREKAYELFLKYLEHMKSNDFYDSNIVAYDYLKAVQQEYDYIVVDEVQDLTNVQIKLLLNSLKAPNNFIFCGDSNQIVHPNFFSWSKVKSLLYASYENAYVKERISFILTSNYRNSTNVTDIANNVLKIKQQQFGSIDKESNYLVQSTSLSHGQIYFIKEEKEALSKLNQASKRSTKYAVIVLTDELKLEAKKYFENPLVFSIYEAKGLEYDNIILFNIVTSARDKFEDIAGDITIEDLQADLKYSRPKDKTDKRTEAYKFYINAFYVAITRSIENIYIIENHTNNAFLELLNLKQYEHKVVAVAEESSLDEWRFEATKLQSQGKLEQAQVIRENILKERKVPWQVLDNAEYQRLCDKLKLEQITKEEKFLLFEYAMIYHRHDTIARLREQNFKPTQHTGNAYKIILEKHFTAYTYKTDSIVSDFIKNYGMEFRTRFNQTALMASAFVGNSALVENLVMQGANKERLDNNGLTAVQNLLSTIFLNPKYETSELIKMYQALNCGVSLKIEDKLVKLDSNRMENFLYNALLGSFVKGALYSPRVSFIGFSAQTLAAIMARIPDTIVPEQRKRRQYISYLLSKHEQNREDKYNKKLFIRLFRGSYILNTNIEIRVNDEWRKLYDVIQFDPRAKYPEGSEKAWLSNTIRNLAERVPVIQSETNNAEVQ